MGDIAPMLDQDHMNGLLDLPIQNPYEEEDLFSLFMDMENFGESYHDTSSHSLNLSNPQPDPVLTQISVTISDPIKDTFIIPSQDLVKDPLIKNDSSKEKEGGSLKQNDILPDPLRKCDPISDGTKGQKVVLGKRHRNAQSLDKMDNGSGLNNNELAGTNLDITLGSTRLMMAGMSAADAERAMKNARLAELALSDPKKAKRTWANRQSAARSKERKARYVGELERRVDSLRHESTTLSAHVDMLQRDTNRLMVENTKLMLEMQAMEQQVFLQNSLSETLQAKVKHLRTLTGQVVVPNDGTNFDMSFGLTQNPYEEEDLFSLFMDMEKFGESYHDTSSHSLNLSNPQPDPVLTQISITISDPIKDTFMEDGSLEQNDILPDPLSECDPISDGTKGQEVVLGKRHRNAQSLDKMDNGSGLNNNELAGTNLDITLGSTRLMTAGMSAADAERAMKNARLAELALSDPKKAKRTWANRQSAARSKERKARCIGELERTVDSLDHESTTLSAHVDMLQRDTNGLMVENTKLMLEMQAMEQQVFLQNSLSETLQAKVKHLRIVTGQVVVPNDGTDFDMSFGLTQNPNLFNGQSYNTHLIY